MKRIFNRMTMLRLKYASGLHQMKNENINLLIIFSYYSERVERCLNRKPEQMSETATVSMGIQDDLHIFEDYPTSNISMKINQKLKIQYSSFVGVQV